MELGRSAPMLMLMSASPGRAAALVPAPVEGRQLRGHRQRSPNSAAPTVGALSLARSALRPLRLGKISGIWQRIPCTLPSCARARGGADSSELRCRLTCTGRLGGAAAAGRRRHFFLVELLVADSGRTMELGRSAPMLMSASPGRAAALVPAPVEGRQLRGHRQRSPNSAAPTVGALSLARSALRPLRLGKISGIWQRIPCTLPSRSRARRRRFQRAPMPTDLHRPAGRRCSCWPTSTFLFGGIVGRRFGADDRARAIGADADVGFAWSGGGAGAGAGGGQGGTGSSATIAKFCSTDSGAYTMHSALTRAREGSQTFEWKILFSEIADRLAWPRGCRPSY